MCVYIYTYMCVYMCIYMCVWDTNLFNTTEASAIWYSLLYIRKTFNTVQSHKGHMHCCSAKVDLTVVFTGIVMAFCNPTKLHSYIMGPEWSLNFICFPFFFFLFFFVFLPFFLIFHFSNCRACLWSTVKRTHSSGALTGCSRVHEKYFSYCNYSKKRRWGRRSECPSVK